MTHQVRHATTVVGRQRKQSFDRELETPDCCILKSAFPTSAGDHFTMLTEAEYTRMKQIRNLRAAHFQAVQVFVEERHWDEVTVSVAKLISLDTELRLLEERNV